MNIAYGPTDLVEQYNRLSSGHFFDRDTMRFFKSKVTSEYRRLNDSTALFVTTERAPHGDTRYATVRLARLVEYTRETDGRSCYKITVETVGKFNTLTLYKAKKVLKEYAQTKNG